MKKIVALTLFLLTLITMSCKSDDDDYISVLLPGENVATSSLEFEGKASSLPLVVQSGKNWIARISAEDNWIKILPGAGVAGTTKVEVQVAEKIQGGPRKGTIHFTQIGSLTTLDLEVVQNGGVDFLEVVSADGKPLPKEVSFDSKAASYVISVNAGRPWKVSLEGGNDWLKVTPSEGSEGQTKVAVSVKEYAEEGERSGMVRFNLIGGKECSCEFNVKQKGEPKPVVPEKPVADLLDVEFNIDGTAKDKSKSAMKIEHIAGVTHMNYYNELYKRNVSHFTAKPGSVIYQGYYKVDYANNTDFMNKLKDGHSLEIVFSTNVDLKGTNEVKMFTSHQAGGTGMMTKGGEISFLPNVGGWKFAKSGIIPEPGRYYHAVGVWDKKAGKAIVYVNGEKKGEVNAAGNLTLSSIKWFGIGGDAGSAAECAWNGDVVLARIYDAALTANQVKNLYDEVKVDQKSIILLSDIQYLPSCTIAVGNKYHIYAKGFKSGDKICFYSQSDNKLVAEIEGQVEKDEMIVTIPSNLKSGKYNLNLKRDNSTFPIGSVALTIGSSDFVPVKTQIVAHRCYHKNFEPNTLKAFVDTENKGIWGAEIDVHITKDKQVVVDHNGFLNNKWDDEHRFSNHTWEEIHAAHPNVSKFEEFLESMTDGRVKTLNMVLEIKGQLTTELNYELVDLCCDLIDKYEDKLPGLKKRIIWISFGKEMLERALKRMPETMSMYLGNPPIAPKKCLDAGIKGIDYSGKDTSIEWINEAHKLGMVVNVWTINSSIEMMDFVGKGVDYITTDEPDILKDLLKKDYITK